MSRRSQAGEPASSIGSPGGGAPIGRREALRAIGRGALAAALALGAGLLAARGQVSACPADGRCGECPALADCRLPKSGPARRAGQGR